MTESKSGSNVLIVLLIVGGALVLLAAVAFVALALVGFVAFSKITPAAPPMVTGGIDAPTEAPMPSPGPEAQAVFDRAELLKLVGRSKDDVRKLLGAPDKTSVNANGSTDWMYRKRSRDTETGKIDSSCTITIGQDGTVTRISF